MGAANKISGKQIKVLKKINPQKKKILSLEKMRLSLRRFH